MRFSIYRYNPETDAAPTMQTMELADADITPDMMLLEALRLLKAHDESLTFRHSCGEGVCGSDAMNINGRNGLACITPLVDLKQPITIRPLPGMPVIRDLVVAWMTVFTAVRSGRFRFRPALGRTPSIVRWRPRIVVA